MSLPPPGSDPAPALPTELPQAFPQGPASTAPPPGYVAYSTGGATTGAIENTAGLRKGAVTLFWAVTAMSAIMTAMLYSRLSVWDDVAAGNAGIPALDNADAAIGVVALVNFALVVAAGIVLSIWSLRLVRNAEQFVVHGLRPGLACGGWYIPIGNLWVPFVRLRETATCLSADPSGVSRWQAGWIFMALLGMIERSAFRLDSFDPDAIRNTLSSQATFSIVTVVVTALTAFLAQRAMRRMEVALDQRHAGQFG